MLIVDSQVHLWAASTPERPWPKEQRVRPQRDVPLGKDEMLREMDAAGVDRMVIVPPAWEGDRNDLALAAARAHPDRFAVMGRLDPDAPESRGVVAGWRDQPGMLGFRFSMTAPALRPLLTEGRLDWLWLEAEKHGIPVMALVKHADVPLIDRVAERHPGLKLVMDHCALTTGKDDEAFREFDKLLAIAKRPNVAVKVSCLPLYTSDGYPFRALHPYIRQVYDAFGPRRMFWGTDFSRLPCSYRQGLTYMSEEIPWLTTEDKAWILGRGVCEWLGWPTR
ncbi:MAG: amidohydrolase [Burkholderiales bacterium]|nr:amidohydrolase [Burkholderiales bacterium]